ncbi:MAG: potassium-transporting ATPase subunit B, partial [Nocardioides sp.]|nr:potassium-transporting ATPase subunit B [Nocardioides sp.]
MTTLTPEKTPARETHQVSTPGKVLSAAQLAAALPGALRKLDPRALVATPVMLVVEIGAFATTVMSVVNPSVMGWLVTVWLWLTVVFGNLAESVAEGRGKAQAASLRALQTETTARLLHADGHEEAVASTSLKAGDVVVVEAGERIPGDGDVIEGVASVDESAVTGESAPVIRESGGDRSA